jgi:hypothetical protein
MKIILYTGKQDDLLKKTVPNDKKRKKCFMIPKKLIILTYNW